MVRTLTKYCIVTEDESQVEVGLSRKYYFANIDEVFSGKCKAQIKFFSTINTAKSAFSASFGYEWDESTQRFRARNESQYTTRYIIKEVEVTYAFKD